MGHGKPMKFISSHRSRRHHNNRGEYQVKHGFCEDQVKRIAARVGVPYGITRVQNDMQNLGGR